MRKFIGSVGRRLSLSELGGVVGSRICHGNLGPGHLDRSGCGTGGLGVPGVNTSAASAADGGRNPGELCTAVAFASRKGHGRLFVGGRKWDEAQDRFRNVGIIAAIAC